MRSGRWIAIGIGLAVVIAALVGWRGSRPTSPIATVRGDGVTVVPATGTLRREEAATARPAPDTPAASPTAIAGTTMPPSGVDAIAADPDPDKLAAAFDRQSRDPSWAPGAEAGLRNGFVGIPHLDGALEITCRATLCRLAGGVPGGLAPDDADTTAAMLQARATGQVRRADLFDGSTFRLEQDNATGRAFFTVWFTRR